MQSLLWQLVGLLQIGWKTKCCTYQEMVQCPSLAWLKSDFEACKDIIFDDPLCKWWVVCKRKKSSLSLYTLHPHIVMIDPYSWNLPKVIIFLNASPPISVENQKLGHNLLQPNKELHLATKIKSNIDEICSPNIENFQSNFARGKEIKFLNQTNKLSVWFRASIQKLAFLCSFHDYWYIFMSNYPTSKWSLVVFINKGKRMGIEIWNRSQYWDSKGDLVIWTMERVHFWPNNHISIWNLKEDSQKWVNTCWQDLQNWLISVPCAFTWPIGKIVNFILKFNPFGINKVLNWYSAN